MDDRRSCEVGGGGVRSSPKPSSPPSLLCSRSSPVGGGLGGRFWVLTPAEEDEEAVSEASDGLPSSPGSSSGKLSPSPSLGLFLLAAEEQGGSLRSSRRSAFAPGGRPSRFPSGGGGGAGSARDRSGSTSGFSRAESRRRRMFPAQTWGSARCPSSKRGMPAAAAPDALSTESWVAAERSVASEETDPFPPLLGGLGLTDVGPACSLSQSSEAQDSQKALELWVAAVVSAQAHTPALRGPAAGEPAQLTWLWIRKASTDLAQGFPASEQDVRRHHRHHGAAGGRRYGWGRGRSGRRPTGSGRQQASLGGRSQAAAAGRPQGASEAGRAQLQQPLQQEAALRDRALAEQGRRRQGQGGSRAGAGENNAPPAWWVLREKKREALRALEAAAPPVPPSIPELGRGRASETAEGKKPVAQGRPAASSGPSLASATEGEVTPASNMECFKCGRMGHFQASCTYPPVCLLCGVEGHNSNACLSKGKQPELRILGQAVPGESFFYLDFDEDEDEDEEVTNGAVISFRQVSFTALDLSRELQHLVEADWDWQVQEVGRNEFAVLFPSHESLQFSTRSGRLFLPLSGTVADIRLADADPAPVELLQEVWVKLTGVPKRMHRANRLLAGMRMLGWPMEVDEGSLRCRQPVRMRIACRNPDKLKGVVQVFHKKQGFSIGIHVESLAGPSGSVPPRSPPQPSHPRDEDEDDDNMDDLSPSRRESEEREDRARAHEGGSPPGVGVPRGSHGHATSPGDKGRTRAQPGVPEAGQAAEQPSVEVRLEAGLDQYGSNLRSPWPAPLVVLEQARACRAEVEAPVDEGTPRQCLHFVGFLPEEDFVGFSLDFVGFSQNFVGFLPEEDFVGSGPGMVQPASPPVASSTLITADSEDFTPSGSPSKDLGGAVIRGGLWTPPPQDRQALLVVQSHEPEPKHYAKR
ncbi:hypothetical protein QYE76_053077 [Lolium multiflorum]|uniref:CCHC-type domain-containing protein n=1 Tax=Lolium multiflorum TaxID=4521 RepID=A0AAD8SUY3_LOLMU|nr:hypothetical protein QYE76_053077 [Lolium multiflorum]